MWMCIDMAKLIDVKKISRYKHFGMRKNGWKSSSQILNSRRSSEDTLVFYLEGLK